MGASLSPSPSAECDHATGLRTTGSFPATDGNTISCDPLGAPRPTCVGPIGDGMPPTGVTTDLQESGDEKLEYIKAKCKQFGDQLTSGAGSFKVDDFGVAWGMFVERCLQDAIAGESSEVASALKAVAGRVTDDGSFSGGAGGGDLCLVSLSFSTSGFGVDPP